MRRILATFSVALSSVIKRDEIQRLNMVAPAAWMKKIDDWRRRELDFTNFRRPSAGWLKWALRMRRRAANMAVDGTADTGGQKAGGR